MSTQRVNQLIEAGMWLQSTGDQDGARRLYEQALKLDPENPRVKELLRGPTGAPRSDSGTRPPTIPPSWNPFRSDPYRDPGYITPSRNDPYRDPGTAPPGTPAEDGAPEGWASLPNKELSPDAVSAWDTKSNPGMLLDDRGDPLDALALVSLTPMPGGPGSPLARMAAASREEVEKLIRRARDLQELDDHSGAMELILRAQELAPMDPEVRQLREKSEQTLLAMYESKLGQLELVPRVALKEDEIIWLNLDHRAGFMLAQIDGQASFEDLFAISGMSRLDTARILAQLVEEGVIRPENRY